MSLLKRMFGSKPPLWSSRLTSELLKHLESGGKRENFAGWPVAEIWNGQHWIPAKWDDKREEWMPAGLSVEEWVRMVGD